MAYKTTETVFESEFSQKFDKQNDAFLFYFALWTSSIL
jgi:hypothetical protein